MSNFDNVLEEAGVFGIYQKTIFFLIYLTSALFSYLYVGFVFLAITPDHWCRNPGVTELSKKCNWTLEMEKNYTIPLSRSHHSSYSQCERYDIDWNVSSVSCDNPLPNSSRALPLTGCQDGWIFENDSFPSIVTEVRFGIGDQFELVCADAWKVDLSQACLNLGFLIGTIFMGYAADVFGRKICFLFAILVTSISGLCVAFSPNYLWFVIFRTLQGLFSRGGWLCGYVLITEIVGSEYRKTAGILNQMWFSIGMMIMPAVAYFIQDWRNLQLAATIPNFIFLSYYWLIPESPRWLLTRKKNAEVVKVLQKMAKRNGKTLTTSSEAITVEECSREVGSPSFIDLVRTPQMRKQTLILMFNWFASALVYQGLILRLGILGENIYLNFFLSGAVEIPASVIIVLVIERIGRRLPFAAGGLIAGGSCLIAALIPNDYLWLKTAIACLGRLGITVTFEMVCFVNTELYPTFLRNFAVSVCSSLCDMGGIVAPFILYRLAAIWIEMPMVVFGGIGLVAGGLVLLLPETKGLLLPDTIEDVENLRVQKKKVPKTQYQHVALNSSTGKKEPAAVKINLKS